MQNNILLILRPFFAVNKAISIVFSNRKLSTKFFGIWCFLVTAASCLLGMYDKNPFTFALNVITPVVLTALGLILPEIAKREQKN